MSRLVAASVVLSVVLVSAAVAGLWTGRWGNSRALEEAVARLDGVPMSLGDGWDGQPENNMNEREVAVAEIEGYVRRRYVHRRTGAVVSMLLVCGRAGPIAAHAPEVCYAGAGFAKAGATREYGGEAGSRWRFEVLDFRKQDEAAPTLLRVFLAWGQGGAWSAPANPRVAFAGKPYLYKLYVVREMPRAGEPLEEDPAGAFVKELMPTLQEVLFPAG
jgi:hypothetical protein